MSNLLKNYLESLTEEERFPKEVIHYLREMEGLLKKKRFIHTCGVVKTSRELARLNGEDENIVMIAAALHDYAKHFSAEELLDYASAEGIEVDEVMKTSSELLHGCVGADMVKKRFGITDERILNAIAYHTIGRVGMSLAEQIVYLADAIEPSRDYEGVDALRTLAKSDMSMAILISVSSTLRYVIGNGILVHPNSFMLYNEMILKCGKPTFEVA